MMKIWKENLNTILNMIGANNMKNSKLDWDTLEEVKDAISKLQDIKERLEREEALDATQAAFLEMHNI
jgi:hypothetical protein